MSSKRETIDKLLSRNTEVREDVAEEKDKTSHEVLDDVVNKTNESSVIEEKKQASFQFDLSFHTKLKTFAAKSNKAMVDVVVEAVEEYMDKFK